MASVLQGKEDLVSASKFIRLHLSLSHETDEVVWTLPYEGGTAHEITLVPLRGRPVILRFKPMDDIGTSGPILDMWLAEVRILAVS